VGKEKYNYGAAYEKAAEQLRILWKQPEGLSHICAKTGCRRTDTGAAIPYFHEEYVLNMPDAELTPDTLPMSEKILLLHYLLGPERNNSAADRDGTEWISFKQLPGAAFYEPTYKKRGPNLVVKFFHAAPEKLITAGAALGGEKGNYGDFSVILHPFPNIDVMLILYTGDDELPPEGQVLFSGNVAGFLSIEDTAVLAGVCAVKCMKEIR
jgi:hypothetical protein